MRTLFYTLDGHTPVACLSYLGIERALLDKEANRVAYTDVPDGYVSTVFLGIDHNHMGDGPPILFETMVFGCGPWDNYQERYATWDEAEAGHAATLTLLHNDPNREGNE